MLPARSYAREYVPKEQLLWPETSQHDVGWLVQERRKIERVCELKMFVSVGMMVDMHFSTINNIYIDVILFLHRYESISLLQAIFGK